MGRQNTWMIGDIDVNRITMDSFDDLLRFLFVMFCVKKNIKIEFCLWGSPKAKDNGFFVSYDDQAKQIIERYFINTQFLEPTFEDDYSASDEMYKYQDFYEALAGLSVENFSVICPKLFDRLCEMYYKYDKGTIGLLNSDGITKLVCSLLKENDCKSIYNPFAGLCSCSIGMEDDVIYRGQEKNYELFQIAQLRLDAYGKANSIVYNEDITSKLDGSFDALVTTPPFGMKVQVWEDGVVKNENSEMVAINRFLEPADESHLFVTVVPASFLYSEIGNVAGMRNRLTRMNMLDCVIQLPGGLSQHTSLATAIVVLNKQRKKEQRVKFINASSCFEKDGLINVLDVDGILHLYREGGIDISTEEILNQNSSWNVQWYWNRMTAVYSENYTVVRLADVFGPIRSTRRYSETKGHLVTIGTLSSDCFSYEKRPNDFPEKDIANNAVKLTEPAVLISMIGAPKPTYCKASEETPIFIKGDICAYTITNKTIHEGYLCLELTKRLIPTMGDIYLRLSRTQILETLVEFPSLDGERSWVEQKNLYDAAKEANQFAKVRELGLQEVIERKKKEYKESIRGRKHAVGQYLSDVSAFWNVLNSFRKEKNGCLLDSDMVDEDYQTTVDDLFSAIDAKLNNALVQFETLLSDDNEWEGLDMDEIEPDWFIKEYIESNQDVRFNYVHDGFDLDEYNKMLEEIELEYWGKIVFPKKALTRVFDDIIKNAVEYGFTDSSRKDYKVLISQELVDIDCWEIRIANNGEPAPDSLDPKKVFNLGYTTRFGKGHSGTGAYEVKQLMEMYGGEVKFISTPDEEYTVTYVLTFKNMK